MFFSRFTSICLGFLFLFSCLAAFGQTTEKAAAPKTEKKEEKKDDKRSNNAKFDPKNLTAEQIVESAIVVYAYPVGREKLNQIRKTEFERGRLTSTAEDGQVTNANYQRWAIRDTTAGKKKIRLDQELPTATYAMVQADDNRVFGIYNDSVFQPREDAISTFQDRIVHSIEALLWYKENNSRIDLAGRDKILGVEYHLIDLTDTQGRKTRFYISQRSFRVMMLDYESGGVKHTRKFRDYKYAQGVLVPFNSELRLGDRVIEEIHVGTVTFGQKVDDSLFSANLG